MSEQPQIFLGFDYGTKRIGVAVGQQLTRSASPLETLAVKDGPDWAAITRLISTWKPSALIVGLPLNLDGTEHALSAAARRFSNQLHGRYNLPVHTVDERLSSYTAQHRAVTWRSGRSKENIDEIAAQIILEAWLMQDLSTQ